MDVIRVIQENEPSEDSLAERYAEQLSQKTADELSEQVKTGREEWSTREIWFNRKVCGHI